MRAVRFRLDNRVAAVGVGADVDVEWNLTQKVDPQFVGFLPRAAMTTRSG